MAATTAVPAAFPRPTCRSMSRLPRRAARSGRPPFRASLRGSSADATAMRRRTRRIGMPSL